MEAVLAGDTLDFAYESLRLFLFCEGTKWAHFPVQGGIYDQHPTLIDEWAILFGIKAEHDRKENEKQRAEMNQKSKMPRGR